MENAKALLNLAAKLLDLKPEGLDEVVYRRAVSTAYYALFHLLTQAAARLFTPNDERVAGVISRIPDHIEMRVVSGQFSKGQLPEGLNQSGTTQLVPDALKAVAKAFIDLQTEREKADYDFSQRITAEDTVAALDKATTAFTDWEAVKDGDMARLYLASFLFRKAWTQSRQTVKKPKPDTPPGDSR